MKRTNEQMKADLIKNLKNIGLKKWHDKDATTKYTFEVVNNDYTVYIYLSNQIRIFIETSGSGSYYIKIAEFSIGFKEFEEKMQPWELVKLFQYRVQVAEKLTKIDYAQCDECGNSFSLKNLRPYKYEPSRKCCDDCLDQLMDEE